MIESGTKRFRVVTHQRITREYEFKANSKEEAYNLALHYVGTGDLIEVSETEGDEELASFHDGVYEVK